MAFNFHVGMKVVAIETVQKPDALITKGTVYTLRDVVVSEFPADNGRLGFRLEEIRRASGDVCEYGWWAEYFRPLIKTDISLLEEIARKITQREPTPPNIKVEV